MNSQTELKAGHAPAAKAGGMRINQNTSHSSIKNDQIPGNLSRAERQQLTSNEDFTHDQEQQIENLKEEKLKEEKQTWSGTDQRQSRLERDTQSKHINKRGNNEPSQGLFQPRKDMM